MRFWGTQYPESEVRRVGFRSGCTWGVSGLDAGLGILLFLFAWRGFWRGFVREVLGLVGVLLGIFLGVHFAPVLKVWFEPFLSGGVAWLAAVGSVFFLTTLACHLVAVAAETILGIFLLTILNRIGGAFVAALKGTVVLAALLLVVKLHLPDTPADRMVEESALGRRIISVATLLAESAGFEVGPQEHEAGGA